MGIYISLVIASFIFIYILFNFLSFRRKNMLLFLLDIVPFIVVLKLFVNKGFSKKKYLVYIQCL